MKGSSGRGERGGQHLPRLALQKSASGQRRAWEGLERDKEVSHRAAQQNQIPRGEAGERIAAWCPRPSFFHVESHLPLCSRNIRDDICVR